MSVYTRKRAKERREARRQPLLFRSVSLLPCCGWCGDIANLFGEACLFRGEDIIHKAFQRLVAQSANIVFGGVEVGDSLGVGRIVALVDVVVDGLGGAEKERLGVIVGERRAFSHRVELGNRLMERRKQGVAGEKRQTEPCPRGASTRTASRQRCCLL